METEPLQGTELDVHWEADGEDLDYRDYDTLDVERPEEPPVLAQEKISVQTVLNSLKSRLLEVLEKTRTALAKNLNPAYAGSQLPLPNPSTHQSMLSKIHALADERKRLIEARLPHSRLDHELIQTVVAFAKSNPVLKRRIVSELLDAQARSIAQTPPLLAPESPTPEQSLPQQ